MTTAHDNFLFIRREMSGHLSPQEVADLCHWLGVNPAVVLRDMTRLDEKVDDLLEWAARNQLEARLLALLQEGWPMVAWPEDYAYSRGGGGLPTAPYMPPELPAPDQLPGPGPLPPGSRLDYDRNPFFTGREDELRDLAQALLYGPPGRPAVIATGIGGIGKTQLAVEFAYRYGQYGHGVHWVSLAGLYPAADPAAPDSPPAGDPEAVDREVAACGAQMRLWSEAEGRDMTLAQQVARTRTAWQSAEPRLVIFDNCEEPDALARWRPVGGGARVLVTSRSDAWPAGFAALAVPTLSRDQSVALLEEFLTADRRPPTDAPAERVVSSDDRSRRSSLVTLAAELGDLPLALTLAGGYLAEYPSIPIADYLAELRGADPLAVLRPRGEATFHSWTRHDLDVARTFRVSLDRLRPHERPADAAALRLLAGATRLVHGEPFPRQLLVGMLAGDDAAGDPHLPDDAIRRLLALGLLERAGAGLLRLHRLLALFAAHALADGMDAARVAVEGAVRSALHDATYKRDPRLLRGFERHLRHVVDTAVERDELDAALLCGELDNYFDMSGDLKNALPYSRKALEIRERVLGPEHPDTASSLNNLGYLLRAMGDIAAARPYYERALGICERVLGPEHPDMARSLNNLGALLQAMGDLAGARPYFERALGIWERVLGPEHPDTARSLNNLGALLDSMGDLAGARPYYERALGIRERVLGPEHPNTATSLNNLGHLLQAMGDLAGARPYYERALAIRERVLGPEHPATATSLNNLGGLLQAMGDLAGARPYYERALGIRERVLGPEHPDTATSLNNLGVLLDSMGDLAEARPYFERALAIDEKVLGTEHPLTAIDYNNLGGLLQALGDLAGAWPYYERALSIHERVLGPEHPGTAGSLNNLGNLLQAMGDLVGARPYYERALGIWERVLGPEHSDTATSLNNLGALLDSMGDLAAARPHYERALAIREHILGPEHPDTANEPQQPGLPAAGDGRPGGGAAVLRARPEHLRTRSRPGAPRYSAEPQQRGRAAAGDGRPGGGAAVLRTRPGHQRSRPRPGASRYGTEPQQPGLPAAGDGRPGGGAAVLRACPEHPRARPRPGASQYGDEPQQPGRPTGFDGRPGGGAAVFRARPGHPRARPRPRASRYGAEPQQPGRFVLLRG